MSDPRLQPSLSSGDCEVPQNKWTPDRLTSGSAGRMSIMGATRRKFTLEFKTEAAHRVSIRAGRW